MQKPFLSLALISSCMIPCSPAIADGEPIPGLDDFINKSMESRKVPGLALGVIKDDKVIIAKGYGVRSLDSRLGVNEQTIFCLGSMTKAFTSAACASLVDEGKLNWDLNIKEILPNFQMHDRCATEKTTLRDLLCMRTGLPTLSTLVAFAETDNDILTKLRYITPVYDFRSGWAYSNESFTIAGKCIEKQSGQSWHRAVRSRLLAPLGMTNTTTDITELKNNSNLAVPHAEKDGKVEPTNRFHLVNGAPAGAIDSNINDALKWVAFHLNEGRHLDKQIISEKNMQEMHKPQNLVKLPVPENSTQEFDAYGFGWVTQIVEGTKVVSHGGNILGMASMAMFVPAKKLGIVVLTNKEGTDERDVVAKKILLHYIDPEHEKDVQELAPAPASEQPDQTTNYRGKPDVATFAGTYRNTIFGNIELNEIQGKLHIKYGKLSGVLNRTDKLSFSVSWNLPISDGLSLTLTPRNEAGSYILSIDSLDFSKVTRQGSSTKNKK